MNISENTIATLEGMGYIIHFQDKCLNITTPSNADEMYIDFLKLNNNEVQYIGKTIKTTKKETTIDYVMNKINTERMYKNFSVEFNKVIRQFGLSAYPTTYGIGVSCLFISETNESKLKSKVEEALNVIGVIYSTEYSDAGWVFRYRISKSTKNIQILNNYKFNPNQIEK